MTKKDSDLFILLQRTFIKELKKSSKKRNYSVSLKTSDPNYNLILIPTEEDIEPSKEYVIYYDPDNSCYPLDIDKDDVYYCTTWDEVKQITTYIFDHPEIFNDIDYNYTLDIMEQKGYCYTVGNIDTYLDNNNDYDISSLYDDYDIE